MASAGPRVFGPCVVIVPGLKCDSTRSDNAVNDEIMHLQAVLDETRLRLHHEQRVSQELQAQMGDERRRGEMRQREMHEKLEHQSEEIRKLQAHLETAKKEALSLRPAAAQNR